MRTKETAVEKYVYSNSVSRYDFTYQVSKSSIVEVFVYDASTKLEIQLIRDIDYSTVIDENTLLGYINLTNSGKAKCINGNILSLVRLPDFKQERNFDLNMALYETATEGGLDHSTDQIVYLKDRLKTAILSPFGADAFSYEDLMQIELDTKGFRDEAEGFRDETEGFRDEVEVDKNYVEYLKQLIEDIIKKIECKNITKTYIADGITSSYSFDVQSVDEVNVFIGGIKQIETIDYVINNSVNPVTIEFSSIPPVDNVIELQAFIKISTPEYTALLVLINDLQNAIINKADVITLNELENRLSNSIVLKADASDLLNLENRIKADIASIIVGDSITNLTAVATGNDVILTVTTDKSTKSVTLSGVLSGMTGTSYTFNIVGDQLTILDNTSNATQTVNLSQYIDNNELNNALASYVTMAMIGVANGVAPLDSNNLINNSYLDLNTIQQITFSTNVSSLPTQGKLDVLYITKDGKFLLWNGTSYVDAINIPIPSQIINTYDSSNTTSGITANAAETRILAAISEAKSASRQIGSWNPSTNKTDINVTLTTTVPTTYNGFNITDGDYFYVSNTGTALGYTWAVGQKLKVVLNSSGGFKWYQETLSSEIFDSRNIYISQTVGNDAYTGSVNFPKKTPAAADTSGVAVGNRTYLPGDYPVTSFTPKQNTNHFGAGVAGYNNVSMTGNIVIANQNIRFKDINFNYSTTDCITWSCTISSGHSIENCYFLTSITNNPLKASINTTAATRGFMTIKNCNFSSAFGTPNINLVDLTGTSNEASLTIRDSIYVRISIGKGWTVYVYNCPDLQIVSNTGAIIYVS